METLKQKYDALPEQARKTIKRGLAKSCDISEMTFLRRIANTETIKKLEWPKFKAMFNQYGIDI